MRETDKILWKWKSPYFIFVFLSNVKIEIAKLIKPGQVGLSQGCRRTVDLSRWCCSVGILDLSELSTSVPTLSIVQKYWLLWVLTTFRNVSTTHLTYCIGQFRNLCDNSFFHFKWHRLVLHFKISFLHKVNQFRTKVREGDRILDVDGELFGVPVKLWCC